MQVVVAQAIGMCFGVRDALAAAEQVDLPEEVSVFGELVHNPAVLKRELTVAARMEVHARAAREVYPRRQRVLITRTRMGSVTHSVRAWPGGRQGVDRYDLPAGAAGPRSGARARERGAAGGGDRAGGPCRSEGVGGRDLPRMVWW